MSVVRIPKPERRPESGGGMDRAVERRGLPAWAKAGLAGAGALLVVLLFYILAPGANSGKATLFNAIAAPFFGVTSDFGTDFVRIGGVKGFMDGSLGSTTAWFYEPYTDAPETSGLLMNAPDALRTAILAADAAGLNVVVHAIGDRANDWLLDTFAQARAVNSDNPHRRFRIEHAQHLHPDDVRRFAELGVVAAMQGVHGTSDGPWIPLRLGDERAESGAYLWRSLIDAGAVIANGTDVPVEDIDPIASFYSSVVRKDLNGNDFFPAQRMTRMEALESYTINNAFAAFEEDLKGTLAVGKLADVIAVREAVAMGLDSDDTLSAGEVGKVGIPIDTVEDLIVLLDGIPFEKVRQVRTSANAIGPLFVVRQARWQPEVREAFGARRTCSSGVAMSVRCPLRITYAWCARAKPPGRTTCSCSCAAAGFRRRCSSPSPTARSATSRAASAACSARAPRPRPRSRASGA